MRFEGRLKSWNTERGFGFIEPVDGGQDTFLHVSAVPTSLRPPKVGQQFTFEVTLSRDGKKRAANVGVAVAPRSRHAPRVATPAKWSPASALAIPLFLAIYVAVAATRGVSIWFAIAYVGFSVVAVLAYALDRSAAVAGCVLRSNPCCFSALSAGGPEAWWLNRCFGTSRARPRSEGHSGAPCSSTSLRLSASTRSFARQL